MALEKQNNFISLQELNKIENVLEENVILSTEINSALAQSSLPLPLPLPPPLFSSLPITLSTPSSVLIPLRQPFPLPLSLPLPPSLPLSLPQSLPHSILKTSFLVENGKKSSVDLSSEIPNHCCQKCGISLLLSFLSETGSF